MLEKLTAYANEKNKVFTERIVPNCKPCLGIYTKDLKRVAKEMVKENRWDFFKQAHTYYDEEMVHIYMITYCKDYNFMLKNLRNIIPLINNWAMCDQLVINLKMVKAHKEDIMSLLEEYRYSNQEYEVRFVLVMLLCLYCEEAYLDYIFEVIDTCFQDAYYIRMAIAWLLCECMTKYKERTLKYLTNTNIDDWTYNKAIRKMLESYKFSAEEKVQFRTLKRIASVTK